MGGRCLYFFVCSRTSWCFGDFWQLAIGDFWRSLQTKKKWGHGTIGRIWLTHPYPSCLAAPGSVPIYSKEFGKMFHSNKNSLNSMIIENIHLVKYLTFNLSNLNQVHWTRIGASAGSAHPQDRCISGIGASVGSARIGASAGSAHQQDRRISRIGE